MTIKQHFYKNKGHLKDPFLTNADPMKKPKLAGSLVINDRVPELGTRLVRFS
jgi:hypothetical protein